MFCDTPELYEAKIRWWPNATTDSKRIQPIRMANGDQTTNHGESPHRIQPPTFPASTRLTVYNTTALDSSQLRQSHALWQTSDTWHSRPTLPSYHTPHPTTLAPPENMDTTQQSQTPQPIVRRHDGLLPEMAGENVHLALRQTPRDLQIPSKGCQLETYPTKNGTQGLLLQPAIRKNKRVQWIPCSENNTPTATDGG